MHGFDIEKEKADTDGTEWEFGAASPICDFAVALERRDEYLPDGELQRGSEDFQDCVTRAYINILETKFTYAYNNGLISSINQQWLEKNGYVDTNSRVSFSDRFIAIKSGTTRTGNSLKAPVHAIHEWGLIPKARLPKREGMSWDEYHHIDVSVEELEALVRQFLGRFVINYEKVSIDDLEGLLKEDMAAVGVYAWPNPVDGEYPRTDNPFTHVVMAFDLPKTYVYDNYPETTSDAREWVKKLAEDYRFFEYGYRVFVREHVPTTAKLANTVSILSRIVQLYKQVIALVLQKKSMETQPITREAILKAAQDYLGKNARPLGLAPRDRGCAEAVCTVLNSVDPLFPRDITYTPSLKKYLDTSDRYVQTLEYKAGCIIISPTIPSQFYGHVGIIDDLEVIYSNNSVTGLWDNYYNLDTWIERYRKQGHLKIHFYEPRGV